MRNARAAVAAAGVALVIAVGTTRCTENERARRFGGSVEIRLDPGVELVNITFKENDLWILGRARKPGESVDTLVFREKSRFGVMQGSITLIEQ